MDLRDAFDDLPSNGNNQSAGPWPNNPTNPTWPGQAGPNPTWPGGQAGPNPTWPGGQAGPNPTWPGGQAGPNPTWPGGQAGPNPTWPGGQPGPNPTWPGGQPGGGGMWPGGNPSQPGPGPTMPTAPQTNLAIPFIQPLPQGIFDKLLIVIAGTIKPKADKITLDFCASNDVAFHFNPRFNEDGKKVIVRNSFIGQKWGKEERQLQNFPFVQGQPFEMKILCTNREFKVAVNNNHLLEFQHRTPNLQSINKLSIYNDLNLTNVQVMTLS